MAATVMLRYARALVEVAAEQQQEERVQKDLREFAGLMAGHAPLTDTLSNPALPFSAKRGIIEKLAERAGISATAVNFLLLLLRHGRLRSLGEFLDALQEVLDEKQGVVRVQIHSTRDLKNALKQQLQEAVSAQVGKQVKLEFHLDPSLIGGLKMQIGSTVYDGTIKTRLEEIRRRLAG